MLKALVGTGAYVANTNIPLSALIATNNKSILNQDNTISMRTTGIKDVKANISFTPGTAGTVNLRLFADGVAIPGAIFTAPGVTTSSITYIINNVVKVVNSYTDDIANISFQFDVDGTLSGGSVIVEHVS